MHMKLFPIIIFVTSAKPEESLSARLVLFMSLPTAPIKLVSRCIPPSPIIKRGGNSSGREHWSSTAIFYSWWSMVKSVNVCPVCYVILFTLSMEVSMVSYFAGDKSINGRLTALVMGCNDWPLDLLVLVLYPLNSVVYSFQLYLSKTERSFSAALSPAKTILARTHDGATLTESAGGSGLCGSV